MKKGSVKILLTTGIILSAFLSGLQTETFAGDFYRAVGGPISIQAQAVQGEDSEAEAREDLHRKKVGVLALFWLTVFLLLMMFFLSVVLLLRRRWRKSRKKRQETVLEDLWWRKTDVEDDADERKE